MFLWRSPVVLITLQWQYSFFTYCSIGFKYTDIVIVVGRDCLCGFAVRNEPFVRPPYVHESKRNSGKIILAREDRRTRRKACPSATSSTKISTWIVFGVNSGVYCDKWATKRQSYVTAIQALKSKNRNASVEQFLTMISCTCCSM